MRVFSCCLFLVLSTLGVAFCQDTNFPSGPQYLMNYDSMRNGSPFLRPISTPTMSLTDAPLEIGASNATGALIAGAGNQTFLPPSPDALPTADLFPIFYGEPTASTIEISFLSEPSANESPASIFDTGVWQITTAQELRERGYGISLVQGAAFGRAHTRHANRVYTNADIDRLHHGT